MDLSVGFMFMLPLRTMHSYVHICDISQYTTYIVLRNVWVEYTRLKQVVLVWSGSKSIPIVKVL